MDRNPRFILYSAKLRQSGERRLWHKELTMKTRTAILVICLAAILVDIGRAQTVYDRAGDQYNCRVPGGKIYDKKATVHKYNIAEAIKVAEHHPAQHDAICISSLTQDTIQWTWPKAKKVAVTFYPMTNDVSTDGTCWNSTNPFTGTDADSGGSDTLQSAAADNNYEWCAYKLQFSSSAGSYDPHIIIKGNDDDLVKFLKLRNVSLEKLIVVLGKH